MHPEKLLYSSRNFSGILTVHVTNTAGCCKLGTSRHTSVSLQIFYHYKIIESWLLFGTLFNGNLNALASLNVHVILKAQW
jgi:hypothetical protein